MQRTKSNIKVIGKTLNDATVKIIETKGTWSRIKIASKISDFSRSRAVLKWINNK